ncbi:hypothetical protein [Thioclava indica]|uniref:Uncharacterized protein n=1 Tax=Thioclava indica TaxID=1353528 RepID=A0A074K1G0_9RHOB|nr:hypothetical protein [Thioclava indica]KEO61588.1 hypothetical protein DT23_01055 [Thioclava indica]
MTLGEVLTAARNSGNGIQDWLAPAEPEIWAALGEAAEAEGLDHATYARLAVADFSNRAPEEDWATMMSRIRDAQDPGQACLLSMITWRMANGDGKCGHSH